MPTITEMLKGIENDEHSALPEGRALTLKEMLRGVEEDENALATQPAMPAPAPQKQEQAWWNSGAGVWGNVIVPMAADAASAANNTIVGGAGTILGQAGKIGDRMSAMTNDSIEAMLRAQGMREDQIAQATSWLPGL